MAIRVPEQQIQIDTPKVQTVPNPGVVRDAFGENVFKANQNFANTLGSLGDSMMKHADEQRKLKNEAYIAEAEMAIGKTLQDNAYSNEVEEVEIEGNKVQRPKGALNRPREMARGSSNEFAEKYYTEANKWLEAVQDPRYRTQLHQRIDRKFQAINDNVISHEATQDKKASTTKIESIIKERQQEAYSTTDPNILLSLIKSNLTDTDLLNKTEGYDDVTSELKRRETTNATVEKAIIGSLRQDPSGATARKLLESSTEFIVNKEDYDDLDSKIGEYSKKVMSEVKRQSKQVQVANESQMVNSLLKGEISIFDEQSIANSVATGAIRVEFGESLIRALKKPIDSDDFDDEGKDQSFVDIVGGIFNTASPEAINDRIVEILDGYNSNNLSEQKMVLLLQTAQKFGGQKEHAVQLKKLVDAGLKSGVDETDISKDYLKVISDGKTPEEAGLIVSGKYGIDAKEYESQEKDLDVDNLFVPSRKPMPPKTGLFEDTVGKVKDFGKGFAYTIASTPQVYSALLKEYGEAPEENRAFWDFFSNPSNIVINAIPALKKKKMEQKERAVKMADEIDSMNREWILQQGLTRPEAGAFNDVAFDLGSGVASIATSVGLAIITKNPSASTALFGTLQKGRIYQEARNKGISPTEASIRSTVAGGVEAGFEFVGLNWILKNYGGRLLNAGIKAAGEGVQEASQSLGESVVANWREQDFFGVAKDAAYAGTLGIVLGGGTSMVLDIAQDNGYIKKLEDSGLTKEQAETVVLKAAEGITIETQAVADEVASKIIEKQAVDEGEITADETTAAMNEEVRLLEKETSNLQKIAQKTGSGYDVQNYVAASERLEGLKQSLGQTSDSDAVVTKESTTKETSAPVIGDSTVDETVSEKPIQENTSGTKKSGIAKSLEAKAIQQKLTDSFGDIAGFDSKTFEGQAEIMSDIMIQDINRAKRIATGKEALPKDLLGITAWKAMETYAMETNDAQLALDLAKSPIATENSEAAQTLSFTRGRDPDTATAKIQEVIKTRESSTEKKLSGKKPTKVKEEIKNSVKEKVMKSKPSKHDWAAFIREIKC